MCARRRRQGEGGAPRRRPPLADAHPTLDLHGETGDSARLRTERWLRDHQRDGTGVVRVVTGRGLHSVGPPVLPGEVADLLSALRGTVVAAFERERSGGAYLVELKRRRGGGRRAPGRVPAAAADVPPHDAELRRRAEESLAELGVSPTPEMIAAEMRRLASDG